MLPDFSAGRAASACETPAPPLLDAEPQSTSSSAGGSLTIVMRTSAPAAASRGDIASVAPAATSSSALDAVRFHTARGCPAFNKFIPMGRPIKPSPIKPIFAFELEGDSTKPPEVAEIATAALPDPNWPVRTAIVAEGRSGFAQHIRGQKKSTNNGENYAGLGRLRKGSIACGSLEPGCGRLRLPDFLSNAWDSVAPAAEVATAPVPATSAGSLRSSRRTMYW